MPKVTALPSMPSDLRLTKSELYIGLMSGTSLDGADAVLVDFSSAPRVLGHYHAPYEDSLKRLLLNLSSERQVDILELGQAGIRLSQHYATVCLRLLEQAEVSPSSVAAIGYHGQTVRHCPELEQPFSLQLGEPSTLVELTGITTVAQFRQRDIAAGGQGAPLVPPFHQFMFSTSQESRIVLNLGGIANITWLPRDRSSLSGFDTGPANLLIDGWCQRFAHCSFDRNGDLARQGKVIPPLLEELQAHPYFKMAPPKSTGRETFHLGWALDKIQELGLAPEEPDILTTLTELTAWSVADAIKGQHYPLDTLILCGGGAYNQYLRERIAAHLPQVRVCSSEEFGLLPDQVEAVAFAWLARQTLTGQPGNHPQVTGAKGPRRLGAIYPA